MWCAPIICARGTRSRRPSTAYPGRWCPYRNHRKTPSFSYGDIRWCLRSRQSISSEVRGVTMKPLALAMGRSHSMLTYSTLQDRPREFLAATSLTHEEFARVLPAFAAAYAVLSPPDKTWEGKVRQRP